MAKLLTISHQLLRQFSIAKQCHLQRLLSSAKDQPGAGVPYEHILKDQATATGAGPVPSRADVVVIGGGAIGCSTLYHLAKLGVTNAVLVEKDELTAGTTWHTAGLLWQLRPNDIEIKLIRHSRERMRALEEETGVNPGWIENGGLFIASSKERLDEYKRLDTIGKVFGIESHVLSPAETQKLYPLMNVKDIYGTLYVPGDGTIEPAGYCSALTRAATKTGAKVITQCTVTGVDTYVDDFGVSRVKGVQTSKGSIQCDAVVNCTGAWAPKIGKMAGVKTPLIPMKHAYVVTEKIDGIQNMPNVRDHDASVYLRLQGDALSVGGYEPNPILLDEVADDFAFSLYDLDWDVFSVHIEGAVNRVPTIETTGIKSTVCGPESFTPDHKPLLGEAPELRGYFHGCGFNSAGLMMSGGCCRELAKWIVQGRPDLDMFSYDIRRFTSEVTDNHQWIKERSHEAYAKNYSIVFKHDEPVASRKMKAGPLYQALLDAGCVYEERQAFERPGWFSLDGPAELLPYDYYGAYDLQSHDQYTYMNRLRHDYTFDFPTHHHVIGNECRTCRDKVAVFDMSYFGKFYLTGPDAQAAADWIFTNNMQKEEGNTMYTCMLSKRGTVEADLTVSRISPGDGTASHSPQFQGAGFYIAAGGGAYQHAWCHIQSVLQDMKFKCTLQDISGQLAMISIQGPNSRSLLQELTSTDLTNDGFPFSTNKVITLAGERMRALRLSFVGELGWELHIPIETAEKVYRAIIEAGQKYGVVNAGYRAIDSLSIEKGYRHWHEDLRSEDTPLEAALAFTCKLKSSVPFQGREALEKQKEEGMKKRIACFTIDGTTHLLGLEGIYRNGEAVGFLRRSEYAFALRKNVAYGFIERKDGGNVTVKYIKEGEYQIDCMGERIPATVHTKSPFDPDHKRVQGIYDV